MPNRENSTRHASSSRPIGLVDHQKDRFGGFSQPREDRFIERRRTLAAVHDQQNHIGLVDACTGLLGGESRQTRLIAGKATRVDQSERFSFKQPADTVVAIAGHSGLIVNESVAAARQRVEQGGLADIRSADQRDQRQHDEQASLDDDGSSTRHKAQRLRQTYFELDLSNRKVHRRLRPS